MYPIWGITFPHWLLKGMTWKNSSTKKNKIKINSAIVYSQSYWSKSELLYFMKHKMRNFEESTGYSGQFFFNSASFCELDQLIHLLWTAPHSNSKLQKTIIAQYSTQVLWLAVDRYGFFVGNILYRAWWPMTVIYEIIQFNLINYSKYQKHNHFKNIYLA